MSVDCTCGNFGCAVRTARGLLPFCSPDLKSSGIPDNWFRSFSAAHEVAKKEGKKVKCLSATYAGGTTYWVVR